jgi:membrane-bound serine protease (ClpP class)
MIGKKCVVKQWEGTSGKVWVGGELWNASSDSPIIPGSETVIQDIKNLTLLVSPSDKLTETLKKSVKR